MPRLGRKLAVEIVDRETSEAELVTEAEGIRRLAHSAGSKFRQAQMMLENAADSRTAISTTFYYYSAEWEGEPQTAFKVVGGKVTEVRGGEEREGEDAEE